MLDFKCIYENATGSYHIETSLTGKPLLFTPQLNKGTAFSEQERIEFNLIGKLPHRVETLDEQVKRAYQQYSSYSTRLQQNIYLSNMQDKNQVLFYKLASEHLNEILPTIYTPIVGSAVKQYSHEYRQPRGLYLSYPEREHMETILDNRSNPDIDLIVVTDGEGVLGIGDQGIGGMDIPVAKLMVYTLCGGINPLKTLPVFLDVGTNNGELLADPMYLGWRHKRMRGQEYDDFVEQFVSAIKRKFPNSYLHWEDFGRDNAWKILDKYQHELCTFNDDIQGTGTVTLAALLAAVHANGEELADQRIVVFGAGTAGTGISDQIHAALMHEGLTAEQASDRFWLIDRQGLLVDNMQDITPAQQKYLRSKNDVAGWQLDNQDYISLLDTVRNVKPTVLVGCSAVRYAFNETVVQEMAMHVKRPIIFPLSNPTEKAEAEPKQLLDWTNGEALIATGSPFDPVECNGKQYTIAQCNNALAFPGIGLGILAVGAKRLSDEMLWHAVEALHSTAPIHKDAYAPVLPSIDMAPEVARKIAVAVAEQAIKQELATKIPEGDLKQHIEGLFWRPEYVPLKKKL